MIRRYDIPMAGTRLARGIDIVGILIMGTAILGLLELFGPAASAQPARPPAQPAPAVQAQAAAPGTGQISGLIKSAADEAPLGRARVIAAAAVLPEPRV